MITFLEKLARFRDYNEMKEYYDRLIERAYQIGVLPRPDTNWEELVGNTMNLEGRALQEALSPYKISNNRKQMYDSLQRVIGNKQIEIGGMSLDPEAERIRKSSEQSGIDSFRQYMLDQGKSVAHFRQKPYSPEGRAKTLFLGRIPHKMKEVLKGIEDGVLNANFPLENFPFSMTMTTGTPHSVSLKQLPLWQKNFETYANTQTHTHPYPQGRKYLLYKLQKHLENPNVLSGRIPNFNGDKPSWYDRENLKYFFNIIAPGGRTNPSGTKAYQKYMREKPWLDENGLLREPNQGIGEYGVRNKFLINDIGAAFGSAYRRDVVAKKPNFKEEIYVPESGEQRGLIPNYKTGELKQVVFMHEPTNRMSPEYKEHEKYFTPRQGKVQAVPRGSFKAFDSAAQKLSMAKKSWFLEKGFTKLSAWHLK